MVTDASAYRWRLIGLLLWFLALVMLMPRAIQAAQGYLYSEHLGGLLTAVNFPGPKAWASSFLQRSLGYEPAWLGASTNVWALINLIAIWLMTTPARGEPSLLRLATRCLTVLGVGLVASVLLYHNSIDITWNPPNLIFPVAALIVEALGTMLIYLYLSQQARWLGLSRIAIILLVGGVTATAAILLAVYAVAEGHYIKANSRATQVQLIVACYGAVVICLAMVLISALLQLVPTYFRTAFPRGVGLALRANRSAEARPVCGTCGYDLRGLPDDAPCPECGTSRVINQDEPSASRIESAWARFVAAGVILFALATLPLIYVVLHMDFRYGFGGTLPMLNFPGPKVWGVPALQRSTGYEPASLGSDGALFCLASILAVWLITWPHPVRAFEEKWYDLRRLARWTTAIGGGAFFGFALISQGLYINNTGFWKWLFAAILFAELPGTVLCYLYLAKMSKQYLSQRESGIALLTACLAGAVMIVGLLLLPFEEALSDVTDEGAVAWVFAGGYGGVMLTVGLLGFAVLLRLIATIMPFALRGIPKLIVIPQEGAAKASRKKETTPV